MALESKEQFRWIEQPNWSRGSGNIASNYFPLSFITSYDGKLIRLGCDAGEEFCNRLNFRSFVASIEGALERIIIPHLIGGTDVHSSVSKQANRADIDFIEHYSKIAKAEYRNKIGNSPRLISSQYFLEVLKLVKLLRDLESVDNNFGRIKIANGIEAVWFTAKNINIIGNFSKNQNIYAELEGVNADSLFNDIEVSENSYYNIVDFFLEIDFTKLLAIPTIHDDSVSSNYANPISRIMNDIYGTEFYKFGAAPFIIKRMGQAVDWADSNYAIIYKTALGIFYDDTLKNIKRAITIAEGNATEPIRVSAFDLYAILSIFDFIGNFGLVGISGNSIVDSGKTRFIFSHRKISKTVRAGFSIGKNSSGKLIEAEYRGGEPVDWKECDANERTNETYCSYSEGENEDARSVTLSIGVPLSIVDYMEPEQERIEAAYGERLFYQSSFTLAEPITVNGKEIPAGTHEFTSINRRIAYNEYILQKINLGGIYINEVASYFYGTYTASIERTFEARLPSVDVAPIIDLHELENYPSPYAIDNGFVGEKKTAYAFSHFREYKSTDYTKHGGSLHSVSWNGDTVELYQKGVSDACKLCEGDLVNAANAMRDKSETNYVFGADAIKNRLNNFKYLGGTKESVEAMALSLIQDTPFSLPRNRKYSCYITNQDGTEFIPFESNYLAKTGDEVNAFLKDSSTYQEDGLFDDGKLLIGALIFYGGDFAPSDNSTCIPYDFRLQVPLVFLSWEWKWKALTHKS